MELYLDNRLRVDLPMPYSVVRHVEVLHDLLLFHRVLVRPALRVAGGQRVEPGRVQPFDPVVGKLLVLDLPGLQVLHEYSPSSSHLLFSLREQFHCKTISMTVRNRKKK
jgi:hypothetical protein